jgi:hypothetical protein
MRHPGVLWVALAFGAGALAAFFLFQVITRESMPHTLRNLTREDAAEAAGFELPAISAHDWSLREAGVYKAQGKRAQVFMLFENREAGSIIPLTIDPENPLDPKLSETAILANGRQVMLGVQGRTLVASWRQHERTFTALHVMNERFGEDEFLRVLASLK